MDNYVANVIPHLQQWWPVIIRLSYLAGLGFALTACVLAISGKHRFNRSSAVWTFVCAVFDARRDNSPGSGAISSSKSLLHICQQNYKKAKGEGNPSPFLFTVYSVSFSRSASTAVSLPRLIS